MNNHLELVFILTTRYFLLTFISFVLKIGEENVEFCPTTASFDKIIVFAKLCFSRQKQAITYLFDIFSTKTKHETFLRGVRRLLQTTKIFLQSNSNSEIY